METFLALLFVGLTALLFGVAAGVVGVAALIARAASGLPTSSSSADLAAQLEQRATGTPEQGSQDGRSASPGANPALDRPSVPKVAQKPRCAICETVRAALFARRRNSAAK